MAIDNYPQYGYHSYAAPRFAGRCVDSNGARVTMTVRELLAVLERLPAEQLDWEIHLDVTNDAGDPDNDDGGWEGDRVVRHLHSIRVQDGYKAIALDACDYADTEKKGFTRDGAAWETE